MAGSKGSKPASKVNLILPPQSVNLAMHIHFLH
jgi:hypothetical protein